MNHHFQFQGDEGCPKKQKKDIVRESWGQEGLVLRKTLARNLVSPILREAHGRRGVAQDMHLTQARRKNQLREAHWGGSSATDKPHDGIVNQMAERGLWGETLSLPMFSH